jgi:hypothetical protein
MAHYAYLDENNIVTQVIVGRDEDDLVEGVSDSSGARTTPMAASTLAAVPLSGKTIRGSATAMTPSGTHLFRPSPTPRGR